SPVSTPDALAAELEQLVRKEQRDKRLPSIAVSIMRDGELAWEIAVGAADVEAKREATPDTQYRLGSITKTFTAAAVMQLRDEGGLDLEDTLDKHVEGAKHAPTIRRLLSHTSGLQRQTQDDAWLQQRFADVDELLATLDRAEGVLPSGAGSTTRTWRSRSSASSWSACQAFRTRGTSRRSCSSRSGSSTRASTRRTARRPA